MTYDISLCFKRIPLCASKVHKSLLACKIWIQAGKIIACIFHSFIALVWKSWKWLPIDQEKFLEFSSCEDIKMVWIFFSFPQPGFLYLKRDGITAATSALCHPVGIDWQSFNLVLTESYHRARRSGLIIERTNYGPLLLFSTSMVWMSGCPLDAGI